MAIFIADGFEDSAISDYVSSTCQITSAQGRRGGKALRLPASVSWLRLQFNPASEIFIHAALTAGPTSAFGCVFRVREGTTNHLLVFLNSNGSFSIYRGTTSTLLFTSAAGTVPIGAYSSLQFRFVISDTVGVVQLKVNGESGLSIDLTNVDTRNSGTGTIDNIEIGSSSSQLPLCGSDVYYDDVVVWDTTGAVNNSWLGDVRVDSYMANADGDVTDMIPSTGASHWEMVDEVPASDSDYVSSASVGATELFHVSDTAHSPATVHAVIAVAQMLKSDAGAREAALVVKSGATESVGLSIALGTGSVKYQRVIETNPNGGVAWTKAAVDALQVGVKVTV